VVGSVVAYFFCIISALTAVMAFIAFLTAFDYSTFEKFRHYPRPIIERTVTPATAKQEPHHLPKPERHRTTLALGTNHAPAPKHLSAPDKNTKDPRAASSAKSDAENRKPERNIRPERLVQLNEPKALVHQRRNYDGHGIAAALDLVGGLAVHAVDSVLTALTPQLQPDEGAGNQSEVPPSQQKPQPGSTPLQSILAAKPLGPASQFQPPSAKPLQSVLAAEPLGPASQFQPPSATPARQQKPPQVSVTPAQQQTAPQVSATPAQQQTAPQVSAAPAPYAAIANVDDRPAASRRVRPPRKQATFTSNPPRYRDETYVPRYGPDQYGAWSGGATQPRGYDRVYNSYGEPRFGPDARRLRRSRVIPGSPETLYPMQTGPPRREQYWGGSLGRYRYGD
jgi:hypothetical protein